MVYSLGMFDSASHWDHLHEQPRFRPLYPSDHVVRFLMANRDLAPGRLLDIGVGGGRHAKLAAELGFDAFGTDLSFVGLQHARERLLQAGLATDFLQASMLALPYADSSFAVVLSYGVFYYGTAEEMQQAIAEVHRVLRPGGKAFVVLRTTSDYRFGKGAPVGRNTFQLEIDDTNEFRTIQHFLASADVPVYFNKFKNVAFEQTDTSFGNRAGVNSDWLITAGK
jgi:SAM-dependent methyltransferase